MNFVGSHTGNDGRCSKGDVKLPAVDRVVGEVEGRHAVGEQMAEFREDEPLLAGDAVPRLPAIDGSELERTSDVGLGVDKVNPLAECAS